VRLAALLLVVAACGPAAWPQQGRHAAPDPADPGYPEIARHRLKRVRGHIHITVNEFILQDLARANADELVATFRFCISEMGEVVYARAIVTSWSHAWDAQLERSIRGWRYQPYVEAGTAIPVCSELLMRFRIPHVRR
jgi:hypothetical protein